VSSPSEPVEKYGAGTRATVDGGLEREYRTHHGTAPPGDVFTIVLKGGL
jgi:hypothetical protein